MMIINALITNKNKPKVITVIGKVSTTKTGFTIKRNRPKTIATIIADQKLATATPGRT